MPSWFARSPRLLSAVLMVVGGLVVAWRSHPVGIVLTVAGTVSLVLQWRLGRAPVAAKDGELPGPEFDYIVWVFFGMPMVFVGVLLPMAIAGAINR